MYEESSVYLFPNARAAFAPNVAPVS